MGAVNAAIYKTEPIFTGLGLGKLSQSLTLSSNDNFCDGRVEGWVGGGLGG